MNLDQLQPLKVYLGGDPDGLRIEAVKNMDWRPTAAILVHCRAHYLVTQHLVRRDSEGRYPEWKYKPDLPKGGVDAHDSTVEMAARRELLEEVFLREQHLRSLEYFGRVLVPFDRHNFGRDGFSGGKVYFLYHAHIDDIRCVSPGLDHGVTEIAWVQDPASAFIKKGGKHTKKGLILSSPEVRSVLQGFSKAA